MPVKITPVEFEFNNYFVSNVFCNNIKQVIEIFDETIFNKIKEQAQNQIEIFNNSIINYGDDIYDEIYKKFIEYFCREYRIFINTHHKNCLKFSKDMLSEEINFFDLEIEINKKDKKEDLIKKLFDYYFEIRKEELLIALDLEGDENYEDMFFI